jgi:hypothetical protein
MPSFVFLGGNPTIIGCKLGKITNQRFNHVLRTVNIMNVTPSNEDFLPIFAHAVPILSIPDSAVGHFKIIPEKLIFQQPKLRLEGFADGLLVVALASPVGTAVSHSKRPFPKLIV